MRERRRRAAEAWRPEHVELLLVADAPPRDDDRYFYFPDVSSHDSLFRHVAQVALRITPDRRRKREQLEALRGRGLFLIDLHLDPAGDADTGDAVRSLVHRCKALDPRHIVLIKATVFDFAYEPLVRAGLPVVQARIPFPGSGRQREFVQKFTEALESIEWFRST